MGAPHSKRWSIYQGYDWRDYIDPESVVLNENFHYPYLYAPSLEPILKEMTADGHTEYEQFLMGIPSNDERLHVTRTRSEFSPSSLVILWGTLNMIRTVVESNAPTLVMQNDMMLVGYSYENLCSDWENLVDIEGYENINAVVLTHRHPEKSIENELALRPLSISVINDIWLKGSVFRGDMGVIYTPHGAQMVLDKKPFPQLEHWLYGVGYTLQGGEKTKLSRGEPPGIYSSRQGIMTRDAYFSVDSLTLESVRSISFVEWQLFFEGKSL